MISPESASTRRPDLAELRAIRAVSAGVREIAGAGDDDVVIVTPVTCSEAGCAPVETVITLRRSNDITTAKLPSAPRDLTIGQLVAGVDRLMSSEKGRK